MSSDIVISVSSNDKQYNRGNLRRCRISILFLCFLLCGQFLFAVNNVSSRYELEELYRKTYESLLYNTNKALLSFFFFFPELSQQPFVKTSSEQFLQYRKYRQVIAIDFTQMQLAALQNAVIPLATEFYNRTLPLGLLLDEDPRRQIQTLCLQVF